MFTDAKHLKAGSNKTCDKNICTSIKEIPKNIELLQKENSTNVNSAQIDTNDALIIKTSPSTRKCAPIRPVDMFNDISKIDDKEKVLEGRHFNKNKRLSCTSLTKLLLELSQQREKPCKINKSKIREIICKVKILGSEENKEPVFALKQLSSGNFEVLLDKEYEKYHKEIIKNYEGDENIEYSYIVRSPSGHYIIDLNEMKTDGARKALIVKTDSGNLLVLVDGKFKNSQSKLNAITSKSVITIRDMKNILRQLPPKVYEDSSAYSRKFYAGHKSSSDSSLFEKVKLNIENRKNLLIDSSIVLKKRCSGEYNVVLNKESKQTFINNIKHYLSTSRGQLPVKVTESGVIIVEVNTIKNHKKQNGFLKITPSGDIFVTLSNLVNPLRDNILDKVNKCCCKAISTTCNGQSDSSCDIKKCICKNICFKSKKWYYENDFIKSSTKKCGRLNMKDNVFDCFNVRIDKEPARNEIEFPREIYLEELYSNHLDTKCHNSNEKCSYHCLKKLESCFINQNVFENTLINREKSNNVEFDAIEDNYSDNWNALDHLPPQLPQFLRDFTYVQ